MWRKNTAGQFCYFQGVDSATGGIKSGVTWTIRRALDGTFAAATGTVTEDGTTGWYKFAASQADSNGNNIGFNFTGTGAVPQTINIITTAADPTDAVRLGLTALPNVASGSAGAIPTTGTGANQISVSSGQVILQAGTGAGQLDFTAGVVKSNLVQILATALTETAGQIAGAFKKVFDVASPVFTALSINQTGDNYARIGAPSGASVSADIAAIKSDTGTILTDVNTGAGAIYTRLGAPAGASLAADIAALPTAAIVKTQVVNALTSDTYAEPGAVPAATSSLKDKIGYLFTKARNKLTQTATTQLLRNDADNATIGTTTVSDDGTTFTKGKDT